MGKLIHAWRATWKTAQQALRDIKKKELQAPDYYQKRQKVVDEMLQWAFTHARPRTSGSLVAYQNFLIKNRDKFFKKKKGPV